MKYLSLTFFVLLTLSIVAQDQIELLDSKELIIEGINLHEKESYEEAIEKYNQVEQNDTNYLWAQYEIAFALSKLEKYDECIEVCKSFLNNRNNIGDLNETYVYNVMGNAYDEAGKTEESIDAYNTGLKKYPKFTSYRLNKALTYKNAEQHDKSIAEFKDLLNENPYYANAHLQLGLLAAHEHQNTQALMSFILSTLSALNENTLLFTDSYAGGNFKPESEDILLNKDENADDFEDLDLIIKNKIALSSKYKTPSKFNFPITKQLYVLIDKLEYDEDDQGFWMQYYVPYFIAVRDEGQFENMTYFLMALSTNEDMKKKVSKKINDVKAFYQWHTDKWNELHGGKEMTINGKKGTYNRWYYNQRPSAAGNKNENKEEVGPWEYYHKNGKLLSYGNYVDGKRDGEWIFFHENGTKQTELSYNDGELEGPYKKYDKIGILTEEGSFEEGKLSGTIKSYYKDGTLKIERKFEEDKIIDTGKEYYANGVLEYEINYNEDNEFDGDLISYYPTGTKNSEMNWKDGNRDGTNTFYHVNEKVKSTYNYSNGKLEGDYEEYYDNDQLKEKGSYSKGNQVGKSESYYRSGDLFTKLLFDENGKRNGTLEGYSPNGYKYYEFEYSKGELNSYKHLDKDGNIIREASKKKNKIDYRSTFDNGQIKSEGILEKDKYQGLWKFYRKNGLLKSQENYENDKLEGDTKFFYMNGDVEKIYPYKDGKLEGYFKSYYPNGKLNSEGNYLNGQAEGTWKFYHENGNLESKNYYLNNKLHGIQEYYDLHGKMYQNFLYDNSLMKEAYFFDTAGVVLDTIILNYGTADVVYKDAFGQKARIGRFQNGKAEGKHVFYENDDIISSEGTYLLGEAHGEWKWYDYGKLSAKTSYVNGERDGNYESYFEDGSIKSKKQYENGVDVGTWEYFYRNGKLKRNVPHQNDTRHGMSEYYSPDGELQFVKYHDNNYLIGYSYPDKDGKLKEMIPIKNETVNIKAYFANGKVSAEIEIKYDMHVGIAKKYYSNGQLESSVASKDGYDNGDFNYYYKDGTLKEEGNAYYDSYHGKRTLYYANGNKKMELNYEYGILYGDVTFYNEEGKKLKTLTYYDNDVINETKY